MEDPWKLSIDFGTSNVVAAIKIDGEAAEVIEIDGELRMPAVMLIDGDDIVFGRVAEEMAAARPADVLRAPKSRLGDHAPVILNGKTFQIVPLVAALLRKVMDAAVTQVGGRPSEVRLTHPATWTRTRQARLLEAAALGGLPSPVLVAEPVAAALWYWQRSQLPADALVAVYDLGGGTFDSAVLRVTPDGFAIVGRPDGDASVGGELFDEVVLNVIGERLDRDAWEQLQLGDDIGWRQAAAIMRREARRVKESVTSYPYADVVVPLPSGLVQLRVERSSVEQAIAPYVADTVDLCRRCIIEAGITLDDVFAVQLVGGSSRIPSVQAAVAAAFPHSEIHRRGDPKHSVALGALVAKQSAITPEPKNFGSSEEQLRTARVAQPAPPPPHPRSTAALPSSAAVPASGNPLAPPLLPPNHADIEIAYDVTTWRDPDLAALIAGIEDFAVEWYVEDGQLFVDKRHEAVVDSIIAALGG